jgi:hypothetical protein
MGNSSILQKVPGAKSFLKFQAKTSGIRALVGDKQFGTMDLAGQLAGVYDDRYKVKPIEPIPTDSPADQNAPGQAADFARRLARKANGRDSTIRTSPAGALYTATPKTLLGS